MTFHCIGVLLLAVFFPETINNEISMTKKKEDRRGNGKLKFKSNQIKVKMIIIKIKLQW